MKRLVVLTLSPLVLWLTACSTPEPTPDSPDMTNPPSRNVFQDPNADLTQALGMTRAPADLGFDEKRFDPCHFGVSAEGGCGNKYLTVVHFQLLCRDSEGTVSTEANVQPIVADRMTWQLIGMSGPTQTDGQGFGHFTVVSRKSTKNQRLILHIGPQFVAFNVSEVTKIVLPKNFCRSNHV